MQTFATEIYNYKSLIFALTKRHLAQRYRGSLLGFLWSFINPLCLMLVYALVFKYYIRFSAVDHYAIFLFTGLLPWLWFVSSLTEGVGSIVASGHLVTKAMFPAHVLPLVAVLTNLVNFILSLPLLFVFMAFYGVDFYPTLFALPALIALQAVFTYGLGLALASLNVYYRDVQHILGNVLNFLFFLCPILYPVDVVPERLRFTLDFNPLAVFTTGYHKIILDGALPSLLSWAFLLFSSLCALVLGIAIYNKNHETFAELL
ncbi:MAG: ABC transporter permease [Candidatus Dadabacteria bacterium]|nr:MAG: ABC transporter permease [Candidatus Dadabacteria bacterium]